MILIIPAASCLSDMQQWVLLVKLIATLQPGRSGGTHHIKHKAVSYRLAMPSILLIIHESSSNSHHNIWSADCPYLLSAQQSNVCQFCIFYSKSILSSFNDTFGEIRIRMGLQCILNDLLQFLRIAKLLFNKQIKSAYQLQ